MHIYICIHKNPRLLNFMSTTPTFVTLVVIPLSIYRKPKVGLIISIIVFKMQILPSTVREFYIYRTQWTLCINRSHYCFSQFRPAVFPLMLTIVAVIKCIIGL